MLKKNWYYHFWPWIILMLVIFSIVFSTVILIIAFKFSDSLISQQWYQDGAEVNNFLNRDFKANINKTYAGILQDCETNKIIVYLSSNNININDILFLYIEHPSSEKLDVILEMNKIDENIYIANFNFKINGYRNLTLFPNEQHWRLNDRIIFPLKNIVLINL